MRAKTLRHFDLVHFLGLLALFPLEKYSRNNGLDVAPQTLADAVIIICSFKKKPFEPVERQMVTLASGCSKNKHLSLNHKRRWKPLGSMVASHATNQKSLVVLACFTTINASCLGVPPSECQKNHRKNPQSSSGHDWANRPSCPRKRLDGSFFQPQPEAAFNRQRDSTRRVLAILTACIPVGEYAASAANLHPCFATLLNVSSISFVLSLVLDPEEDVIRAVVPFHVHLFRAPRETVEQNTHHCCRWTERLFPVRVSHESENVCPLPFIMFSGHAPGFFFLIPSIHCNLPVSKGRHLQCSLFHSSGLLKPHSPLPRYSKREVSETPISPCSPNTTLPLRVSSLRPFWFYPWCRISIAPHQKKRCLLFFCKCFLRHLLCCPSSFAVSARSFISFLSFLKSSQF